MRESIDRDLWDIDPRRLSREKKSRWKIIFVPLFTRQSLTLFDKQPNCNNGPLCPLPHCTLCFLRANDLSLTAAHRKHHRGLEDEEKSEGNAIACMCDGSTRGAKEHNTGTAARSLAGGPRLSSASICRYSRVRYYRA